MEKASEGMMWALVKEQPEDQSDRLCLLRIDDELPVFPFVITEKAAVGKREPSVCHLLSGAPGRVLGDAPALLLCKR